MTDISINILKLSIGYYPKEFGFNSRQLKSGLKNLNELGSNQFRCGAKLAICLDAKKTKVGG